MSREYRRRGMLIIGAFFLAALVFGGLVFKKYRNSTEIPPVPLQQGQQGTRQVTLFFADAAGEKLAREGREIEGCEDLESCVTSLVEELINGPIGDLGPTLPPGAAIVDVQVREGMALVDFGKGLVESLPGGSSSEMMAVYSVVDSICLNFPEVKKVKFRIDGQDVQSLRGHLDLREPLAPDYTLEGGAVPPGPAEKSNK